jgi:integrase
VEHKLCAVRSLLRFAAAGGLTDRGVLETVPAARSSRQARIPSVWDPADVAKIIEAIDRGNPSGKRDYAIVLLICRLGLRAVDVKRLRFGDLDWPGNRVSVVQAKTGRRVWLPLLKDVGWAIIDYVRDGRPASDCPEVFLRHTAPIGPFSDQDHLHQILVKHARVAHVHLGEQRRHGMHSLRHTLATRLMEDGTPVEQIADILGHQSVESTGVYLKSSLGLLAKCALDPDRPAREGLAQAQAAEPTLAGAQLSPHVLRHSRAMHLYDAGVPLPYIRDILGHADLSTTDIYARASTEAKRKALEAVYDQVVSADLAEWNQDSDLLNWLTSL